MKRPPQLTRLGRLLLILLFTQASLACKDRPKTESDLRKVYEDKGWTVRVSDDGTKVTTLVGGTGTPLTGAPAERASQFLRENQLLLGLEQSDLKDLKVLEVRDSPFGANVELQQVFNGLPVENGRIKLNFDKDGRVLHVVSSYTPTAGSSDRADRSKDQAAETASVEFLHTTPIYVSKLDEQQQSKAVFVRRASLKLAQPAKVDDVYFVRKGRLHRAFKTFISAVKPFGIKEIVTDAQDGEVLEVKGFVYTDTDVEGQVFKPNPVNTRNASSFSDNDPVDPQHPNPYFTVQLLGLEGPTNGPLKLRGPFVALQNIEPPANTPPPESSPNKFIYRRGDPGFEDVMVYYHIDRMQRYIQSSLNFMNILNSQLPVDAHGNDGVDNSHYIGSSGSRIGQPYIAFGNGSVDDAEDGDVIAHEYGHAIQDNQAPGKYGVIGKQSRAMAEGFADYWAVSSFRDETKLSGHDLPCVLEWDKVPHPSCIRRVDTLLTAWDFNRDKTDHFNGQIWSAILFDILKLFPDTTADETVLDKKAADKLILESHFNIPDRPSFVHGADAILTADRRLFGGVNIPQLCRVFEARKIYGESECESRPAATGNTNSSPAFFRWGFRLWF